MAKTTLKIPEFLEGRPKRVEIEGKGVLVARVGDAFYAIGDRCTHLGCSLSEGTLQATQPPPYDLQVSLYLVSIESGARQQEVNLSIQRSISKGL